MRVEEAPTRRVALLWILPAAITAGLLLVTAWVAGVQVRSQRQLLQRHTEDVCEQAARRLQVLIGAELQVADAVARIWAGEEGSEATGEDFAQIAAPLLGQLSGYQALGLFDAELVPVQVLVEDGVDLEGPVLRDGCRLCDLASAEDELVVSRPVELLPGRMSFLAVRRIDGGERPAEYLAVALAVDELVADAFQGAIGLEFDYYLEDHDEALFHLGSERFGRRPEPRVRASEAFPVANRTWVLHVTPHQRRVADTGPLLLGLLFGVVLSIGLGVAAGLLTRRMVELERSRARHRRAEERRAELARQVLRVQEDERAHLSRELHDELGQLLTGVRVELDVLRRTAPQEAAPDLASTYRLLDLSLDSVRRLCRGLRPPALDDLGLVAALRQIAGEYAARQEWTLELDLAPELERRSLPEEVGVTFYRVLQEALTNVARHAAAARVTVALYRQRGELVLEVRDDGRGFDPGRLAGRDGVGLAGMRERARLIDGDVEIRSDDRQGTTVTLRAPLPGAAGEGERA